MKKSVFAIIMCIALIAAMVLPASAADVPNATIDPTATGSLTIYKYDFTQANLDGNTTVGGTDLTTYLNNYTSDGLDNAALRAAMTNPDTTAAPGSENPNGKTLGNGQTSNGYAIKGVEFSYLKVGSIVQVSETVVDPVNPDNTVHTVSILYEMDDTKDAALLAALGLSNADAYTFTSTVTSANGDPFVPAAGCHYFMSDVLIAALRNKLATDPTTLKNDLEAYMTAQNASHFAETDANGRTTVSNLPLGLYLVVETLVPEMVTATTAPFFVSVPMTTVNGTVANNGGQEWLYDVTLFPKNETGIPTLEKTVRVAAADTGTWEDNENGNPTDDGYAHTATASTGDKLEYQLCGRMPIITSESTNLTIWSYLDTMSKGLEYNGNPAANTAELLNGHYDENDVVVEFYSDANYTTKIATWRQNDATPKFTVDYDPPVETGENAPDNNATSMQVTATAAGFAEINANSGAWTAANESGYSNCYYRVTYSATLNMNDDVVLGDSGNPNTVVLKWQRSNTSYYDTLTDDAHVYTYAFRITKMFSDGQGNFANVKFKLFNKTDSYWVVAEEKPAGSGVYYVVGHEAGASDDDESTTTVNANDEDGSKGTTFVPCADNGNGYIEIRGLENDEYIITEVETDNGYNLLAKNINFELIAEEDEDRPCGIYAPSVDSEGVWQNKYLNAVYAGAGTNYKQDQLQHDLLTYRATVDGDEVPLNNVWTNVTGNSQQAMPGTIIINTHVPDLPVTGEEAQTPMFIGAGVLFAAATLIIFFLFKKKEEKKEE